MMLNLLLLIASARPSIQPQRVTAIRPYTPFMAQTAGALPPEAFLAYKDVRSAMSREELDEFCKLAILGDSGPKFDRKLTRLRIDLKNGVWLMDTDGLVLWKQGSATYEYALPAYAYLRMNALMVKADRLIGK